MTNDYHGYEIFFDVVDSLEHIIRVNLYTYEHKLQYFLSRFTRGLETGIIY